MALRYGIDSGFWRGRRVLLTGHTGFKGSWMCAALHMAGAQVTGVALAPETDPSLFELAGIASLVDSRMADVRDLAALRAVFDEVEPEVVIHMAAQPIVLAGFERPAYTYETNVMGTVNVLECCRLASSVRSVLNVTTDKVYLNVEEDGHRYTEGERLDGFDPYSNSKSCSELVTATYVRSFFGRTGVAVSTARSGNVIGAGDYSDNRIVPDCVRAAAAGEPVVLRNPNSTRPYQHVMEPVAAYMELAAAQCEDPALAGCYNVGPHEDSCVTTGELASMFCESWGEGASWLATEWDGPHEANFLALDPSKIERALGWEPRWDIREAVARSVAGYRAMADGRGALAAVERDVKAYYMRNEG